MTQYVKKTFEHAWQAVKAFQENIPLYAFDGDKYTEVGLHNCLTNYKNLYTIKPTDWREHIIGKVLCLCQDDDVMGGDEFITAVIRYDSSDGTFLTSDGTWVESATPLTRAEIARFMENAPE